MREINKKEIQTMDTPNLTKMRNIIRDKWTWETGSDEDKKFLDFIESELSTREVAASTPEPYFEIIGDAIRFNGAELFEKSYDYQQQVMISDDLAKAIKVLVSKSINGYSYISYNDDDIGTAVIQKIDSAIQTDLRGTLDILIRNIIRDELSIFESHMREDFRCQLDILKFELKE